MDIRQMYLNCKFCKNKDTIQCPDREKFKINPQLCPEYKRKSSLIIFAAILASPALKATQEAVKVAQAMDRTFPLGGVSVSPPLYDPGRFRHIPTPLGELIFPSRNPPITTGLMDVSFNGTHLGQANSFEYTRATISKLNKEDKEQMTKQKAKNLSIQVWQQLAQTGCEKDEITSELYKIINNMDSRCPLCEYQNQEKRGSISKCSGCPLHVPGSGSCADGIYSCWNSMQSGTPTRKKYAQLILEMAEAWDIGEEDKDPARECTKWGKARSLRNNYCPECGTKHQEELDLVLSLEVDSDNDLRITLPKDEGMLGFINPDGECYILSDGDNVVHYEKWRAAGMKVDTTYVEWRGSQYGLTEEGRLKGSPGSGMIYDFRSCLAESGCTDNNIKRFKHNNRPIIF